MPTHATHRVDQQSVSMAGRTVWRTTCTCGWTSRAAESDRLPRYDGFDHLCDCHPESLPHCGEDR